MTRARTAPERSAISEVMAVACPRHHTEPNQWCWIAQANPPRGRGVCGTRIKKAFPQLRQASPEALGQRKQRS